MTPGAGGSTAGHGGGGRRDRDRRVKELFERVLDAPQEQREEILAAEGVGASLQREVRELLRAEAALGGFLETPATQQMLGAAAGTARLAPGDRVADFTVVGFLAEGGGGAVYEAEQREPRRRVALKMIRVRRHAGDALERFRDEAANLARLHHAAIGHVYAAGVEERAEGRFPWIAMELVDGARNVVRHAREEALSRDDRLRLFLGVCGALHHAHQKGVVHRDVTPGNVLVDAEGHPKVVDFGVACSVAEGAERASDAVGTLAYASPEQLAGDSGGVDLRADVYGLGALLYELLTGALPHEVDDVPVPEAARRKRDERVVPPSQRAAGLPRDLDAIVLRALAPEREARYGSAAELAADVRRFLADEPVDAHAGGVWYRLGKFVRRRRAATAAIAGIGAALVAGAGVSLWFAVENAAAREHAEWRSYVAEIAAAASALRVDDVAEARRRLDRAPVALRDWEWRHLASRIDTSVETVSFPGHELWYGSVSRDGELVAVSGGDRNEPVGAGYRFAALRRRDGTSVREWRVRADSQAQTIHLIRGDGSNVGAWRSDEISGVPACAISSDGSRLVVGLSSGGVLAYDVARDVESPVFAAHAARVIAVAFSPDGSRFATAGKDATAKLWSWEDRSLIHAFRAEDRVICLAFDPAGERLVTGCRDGSIGVFDSGTGETIRVLTGHEASVEGVSVSPDGARLASVSRDRTVRLWNLADGGVVAVGRSHASNVRDVAFDPRGGSYVSASWDGTLRVWDARTGAETGLLHGHASAVTAVAFSDREPRLVSFSRDGTLKRWDPERTDVATCRGLGDTSALAFDRQGHRVAVGGNDGRLTVLDARTARATQTIPLGSGPILDLEFLDGRALVLVPHESEIQVWDLPSQNVAPRCTGRIGCAPDLCTMAVDRGGTHVWTWVVGGASAELSCVDVRSGAVVGARSAPVAGVLACDGRGGVAVGGRDGTIGFSGPDDRWVAVRPSASAVTSLAFDDAGERIVATSLDGTARVLRTRDLATLLVLAGHSDAVNQAEFLPGGRRIVTVSRDLTTRLWDAESGENVLVLHEHGYPVNCVAVSRDGTRIATGAGATEDVESTVKIWEAPPTAR